MTAATTPRPRCTTRVTAKRHACSWWHAGLVDGFRSAQHAQQVRAEQRTGGYDSELADYFGDSGADPVERRLTFREWLIGHRAQVVAR